MFIKKSPWSSDTEFECDIKILYCDFFYLLLSQKVIEPIFQDL